ncbi:MAG: dihydropteroate synthase, partial [Bdellovibrionales bacterium]|nr:dihydropteroate synthase [Bdellovibrionales bacterium]
LSKNPNVSWEIVRRFKELKSLGYPLMLAVSRKSFLGQGSESLDKRDELSVDVALSVARQFDFCGPDYIRVHNVAMHRRKLTCGVPCSN